MNADVFDDLYRLTGKRDRKTLKRALMYNDGFRFLYFWRHAQEGRGIKRKICVRIVKRIELLHVMQRGVLLEIHLLLGVVLHQRGLDRVIDRVKHRTLAIS